MRKLAPFALAALVACQTTPPGPPVPPSVPSVPPVSPTPSDPGGAYGLTLEEEARILQLEDRREWDAALVEAWGKHPNPLHRLRLAVALGRIGPHTFLDLNGNGSFDQPSEKRAGVDALAALSGDTDRRVREAVAFALGEIGDFQGISTLFYLTTDADASVAAEAVEAISKIGGAEKARFGPVNTGRYIEIARGNWPEGIQARAVRYLFRLDTDEASNVAMNMLDSPSSAVRQEAAYSLARRAYPPGRDSIELVMNDANVLTRAYATVALGRIGRPESMPHIVTALGDAHPWVRTNAAIAFGRIAEKDRSVLRPDLLPRVFAVAEDPDPGTRVSIIDVLGYYAVGNETARKRLTDLLTNGSQWERELAAGAIAKHFAPESETFKLLGDAISPWAKVRVIEATAAMPHGAAIRKRYASAAEPLVRAAVLGAIPDDKADAEIEIIRAGLADADVIVRANALDRYGATQQEEPQTWFKTLQDAIEREKSSEMNDARFAAISALAKYEHFDRPAFLGGLLQDNDPVVRRAARDLLLEKHQRNPQYTPLPVNRPLSEYVEIVKWSREPHTATIHMTRGDIQMRLLTQDAPMTTWNFAQLARRKYFDNSSFMRVVPNFVIQGGDPRNDMSGGPGYAIRDEINLQKYTRGAVGMALSGPDTGGSQFFITHSPQPHLDGGYTIFGRVYDGMNGVVDVVERGDRVTTITIDEHASPAADAGVANVSLPLEIGPTTAERLLARVPEYEQRKKDYAPDFTVIEMMKQYVKAGDRVEVIMGTWCSDSQREVPKFLRILDELKSQYGVDLPATFLAVDKAKQQPAALIAGKDLQKVATFIYYRGDREVGRIVEKVNGPFEDELLAIAAKP